MTYKAVGRSIINYAAPVWSINLCDTNYRNIKYTQNEALRIATGCHKMSSVLHVEAKILKVREHSELLSAQYFARCLEPGNVYHSITTRETPKRRMMETLFTRHRNTVEPMMLSDTRKATLQAIHTDAVNKSVKDQKKNIVLDDLPHPINDSEKDLIIIIVSSKFPLPLFCTFVSNIIELKKVIQCVGMCQERTS